jgi:hypothetical protein
MTQNGAARAATSPRWIAIVSGLPRSGTSMMMQILDAGGLPVLTDQIRRPDEDNPRGYYEFERVKQTKEDPSWLEGAEGKVVKMVYRLLYDLPRDRQYRVVFMKRRLEEVIASQEEMLQHLDKPSGQIDEAQLLAIYRRQLQEVESWLAAQPNFQVLYLDYHDVLQETDRVVDEIDRFLDVALNTAAMRAVPDRALYRQRR